MNASALVRFCWFQGVWGSYLMITPLPLSGVGRPLTVGTILIVSSMLLYYGNKRFRNFLIAASFFVSLLVALLASPNGYYRDLERASDFPFYIFGLLPYWTLFSIPAIANCLWLLRLIDLTFFREHFEQWWYKY
jgi:hypothetical protein